MQPKQIGLLFALLSLSETIVALAQTGLRKMPDLQSDLKSGRSIDIDRHWVVSEKNAPKKDRG